MSISERQYTRILSEELLRYLLEGKVPDITEVAERINEVMNRGSNVTYQYFHQPSKDVFQVDLYNDSLRQIKFDIDIFQEELLNLFSDSIKRVNFAELYHKINSYELNNLQAKLEAVLFSIENADYYFLNVYDNFTDSSKIDLELSTPEVLNLAERILHLPYGSRATKRVSTAHLVEYSNWTINVLNPISSEVYRKGNVPGSKFGSMFVNGLESWSYEILSKVNESASIQFVVPLAGAPEEEKEVFVNRLEVISHSIGPQKIKIEVSSDNVNYLSPLGYEAGINLLDSSRVYAMDFETNLVQYVRITLSKDSADQTVTVGRAEGGNVELFQYIFGLKSFSAYSTGRVLNATYISKPFSFDSTSSISKISIKSDYVKPEGTNLSYSIALTDPEGKLITDYIPINPVGKKLKASATSTITFENTLPKSVLFTAPFYVEADLPNATYGRPYRSKYLYKLFDDMSPAPIFNSIKITRGFKVWARDTSVSYVNVTVPDCYLNFSYTETESLYSLKTESCSFVKSTTGTYANPIGSATPPTPTSNAYRQPIQRNLRVNLTQTPYFEAAKGHLIRPLYNLSGAPVITPNYAIYKIKHIQATRRTSTTVFIPDIYTTGAPTAANAALIFSVPVTNFIINSANTAVLPTLVARTISPTPVSYTLVRDVDYIIETVTVDSLPVPTGRIKLLASASNISNGIMILTSGNYSLPSLGLEFIFTYTPETDITHRMTGLNGTTVTLENCFVEDSDIIEVTYRYVVVAPDEIIRSSVEVYNAPSINEDRIRYVEGIDYLINSTTNVIRRLDTGNIPNTGGVFIKYRFRNAEVGMQIFTTWCKIDNPAGAEIKFSLDSILKKNKLIADSAKGETVYINGPFGLIDITNAASTPNMPPGWIQFIVRSKNPSLPANVEYGSNLIDQVIQLEDINYQKIFREGGTYFSTVLAYKEPMIQKTLNQLKINTLATDTQFFAIDDETDPNKSTVVVNFLPQTFALKELYQKIPSSASVLPQSIGTICAIDWDYLNAESKVKSNNLVVRIDLDRDPSVDGALTPKVSNYQVRVGL